MAHIASRIDSESALDGEGRGRRGLGEGEGERERELGEGGSWERGEGGERKRVRERGMRGVS